MPVRPIRLASLLPGLLVVSFAAAPSLGAQETLPSGLFSFDELPVRESGTVKIRQMMTGLTHSAFLVDLHVTELAVGEMPHAPHSHVHEEMLLILEGELDVTVAGEMSHLAAGSAVYVASGDEHGWRNTGTTPARYFVLALGDDGPNEPSADAPAPVTRRWPDRRR